MAEAFRKPRETRGRAPKPFDERDERVRGTLQSHLLDAKSATKNPTRFVPDLPGFCSLTKSEIKLDTWDIDKCSSLMDMNETDSEDEDVEETVLRSLDPPCPGDTFAEKKKKRFVAWTANAALVETAMEEEINGLSVMRAEHSRLLCQENNWIYTYEVGRGQVCSSLSTSKAMIDELKDDTKLIHGLLAAECGSDSNLPPKRRTSSARDALRELHNRLQSVQQRVQEYETLSEEYRISGKAPITSTDIDELDYPEDAVAFNVSKNSQDTFTLAVPSSASSRKAGDNHDNEHTSRKDGDSPYGDLDGDGARGKDALEEDAGDNEEIGLSSTTTHLVQTLRAIETSTRLAETALIDLDVFFSDEEAPLSTSNLRDNLADGQPLHVIECERSRAVVPGSEQGVQFAVAVDAIRVEAGWAHHLQELVEPSGSNERKRRRGLATIPISTFAYPRTPREVPLFISPLSQYEDKFLGAILIGSQNSVRNASVDPGRPRTVEMLPPSLAEAEDAVLERCKLQANAATTQNKIRKLRVSALDWRRQLSDGHLCLKRAEKSYQQAAEDDYQEAKRIRMELLALGIASVGSDEMPMSPVAETTGWTFSSQPNLSGRGSRGVFAPRRPRLIELNRSELEGPDDGVGEGSVDGSAGGILRPKGVAIGNQGRGGKGRGGKGGRWPSQKKAE